MNARYALSDVCRAYDWLDNPLTEVAILHPAYRRGDTPWNRMHDAWPITAYVRTERALLRLIHRYAGERLLCYGLNPRPSILQTADRRLGSAQETDIVTAHKLMIDMDLEGRITQARLRALVSLLDVADDYFRALGIQRPARASSGSQGSHLLFAYPSVRVADVPDLRERLGVFVSGFATAMRQKLMRLEARVDPSSVPLRAMAKVYGSAKPRGGVSRFYGGKRIEDTGLRDYLLGLPPPERRRPASNRSITISNHVPKWFDQRLQEDVVLRDLWNGKGKPKGTDHSVSGYDFSVLRHLVRRGYRNADELGTILALRSAGFAERCTKGQSYLERTVGRALAG